MKRVLAILLCLALMAGIISAEAAGLDVVKRSHDTVMNFLNSHPTTISGDIYDVVPGLKAPYSLGKLKDEVIHRALNALNSLRFVAGLRADVTISEEYTEKAQAAAVVNAVNGSMSHYPTQPAGMSVDMYELGYDGASHSNIAYGYGDLSTAMFKGWIHDGDSRNIDRVGHRRWVLNPRMRQTGFGMAGTQMAMYALDGEWNMEGVPMYVAWPAQMMPIQWMSSDLPWSVSSREPIRDSATVIITRRGDGQSWTLSAGSGEGYFNVSGSGYGTGQCLIFRPAGIKYNAGDHYDVTITGIGNTTLNYAVELYHFDKAESFAARCYEKILGREGESEGVNGWATALRGGKTTAAEIIYSFMSSDEFTQKNKDNGEIVETLYQAMLGRSADEAGKQSWTDLLEIGNTFGAIINGFCASAEFTSLCQSYGIKAGSVPGVKVVTPVPGANLTKIKAYVSRCYRILLGREADQGGLTGWARALATGEAEASQIIDGFVRSPEYINRNLSAGESVDILYRAMLDREADEGGKAGWVDAMSQGFTLQHIINGFCGSVEFGNICSEYGITPGSVAVSGAMMRREAISPEGNEAEAPVVYRGYNSEFINEEKVRAFVEHCYESVFGRAGDAEGVQEYTRLILEGVRSPKTVAKEFVFSGEFQSKLPGNEEFIRILYRLYCGREADAEGLAGWVAMLEGGAGLEEIVDGFAGSEEFKAIVNSMKNEQ